MVFAEDNSEERARDTPDVRPAPAVMLREIARRIVKEREKKKKKCKERGERSGV